MSGRQRPNQEPPLVFLDSNVILAISEASGGSRGACGRGCASDREDAKPAPPLRKRLAQGLPLTPRGEACRRGAPCCGMSGRQRPNQEPPLVFLDSVILAISEASGGSRGACGRGCARDREDAKPAPPLRKRLAQGLQGASQGVLYATTAETRRALPRRHTGLIDEWPPMPPGCYYFGLADDTPNALSSTVI